MIRCRTLGGCDLEVDGGPPPKDLQWRKNRGLLVYLARSPRRGRTRDQLIGLLWADKPEEDARGSLKTALSTLRQHVGEGGLVTGMDQVRLNPGFVELDVDRFEYLAQVGDLKGATELVNGDFLEGFNVPDAAEFEQWALAERTRLRPRLVDVLTKRAEELLDLTREAEALPLADKALHLDGLHEPAVRAAMRALGRTADRTEALRRYEVFKTRLAEEVEAAPDRETEALASRLREETWRPPREAQEPKAKSEPARRALLEDRVHALTRLVELWRGSRSEQRPSLAIVAGDPGMGKTRLVEELAARARVDGAVVVGIRAVEADLTAPWSGLLGLCRGGLLDAPGATGTSPDALAVLRSSSVGSPGFGRAFSEAVGSVSHEQPVVLVVDDAQWVDRESLLALLATLRDLPGAPLLIVVTVPARVTRAELDDAQARLGRDVTGAVIRLAPLSPEAIVRMAQWALPITDSKQLERLARRVAADSACIPLLAVALLEAIRLGLELKGPDDGWLATGRTLDQTLPGDLPDSVIGAGRVLYARLGDDCKAVLRAAAVLGRAPGPILGAASGITGPRLAAALDDLERRQWLTVEPRGYAFVARIFQQVIGRDQVTDGERARIREAAKET